MGGPELHEVVESDVVDREAGDRGAGDGEALVSGRTAAEIGESIESAIREGELGPGDNLPTVRSLAADLGVSPTTVAAAYRQLRLRGVISTHGRGGTKVNQRPPLELAVLDTVPEGAVDLRTNSPELELLPGRDAALRSIDVSPREQGTDLDRLLDHVRSDLRRDKVPANRIALAPERASALAQLLSAQLRTGDRVAVEDPVDPLVRDLLTSDGMHLVPIETDANGALPGSLATALSASVSAVVLTPRGHDPTAAAWDDTRCDEISAILDDHEPVLVVEQDWLASVGGAPYRSAVSQERARWAVIRSYGYLLGLDLDITAVAGDPGTVARLRGRQLLAGGRPSVLDQALALELMTGRDGIRAASTAGHTYSARRITLLAELRKRGIRAQGTAGTCVWVPVDREEPVVDALLARGWAVTPGSRYRLAAAPGIRISTCHLHLDQARALADDLLEVLAA